MFTTGIVFRELDVTFKCHKAQRWDLKASLRIDS